jgi:hypothetical protein
MGLTVGEGNHGASVSKRVDTALLEVQHVYQVARDGVWGNARSVENQLRDGYPKTITSDVVLKEARL